MGIYRIVLRTSRLRLTPEDETFVKANVALKTVPWWNPAPSSG